MSRRSTVLVIAVSAAMIVAVVTGCALALFKARDEPTPTTRLTIAVVGDAYTAGRNNRVVWPTLLARRTGWSVANFALPDAGFAADGQGGQAFSYQAERAQEVHPQLILVVAGIADLRYAGAGDVSQGANDAINRIKLSGVRALVVGPTWYEKPVPQAVKSVSDEIRQVAEKTGVPFLDALDPPWLTADLMQPAFNGPTDDGQSVIADKIAAWLRTEVAR